MPSEFVLIEVLYCSAAALLPMSVADLSQVSAELCVTRPTQSPLHCPHFDLPEH